MNLTRAGLRQPWHDIHAKVEGPVAMDICLNFMERWAKQAGKLAYKEMHHLDDHGDIHLPAGYEVFMVRNKGAGRGHMLDCPATA
jgi:phosphatidylserine/phosphatidylglycerophosphate/cardiolipin synthase-like enzyme